MKKRTIPALPAGLIDPRPVIGAGTGAWLVVVIVALVIHDYGVLMWTGICGLLIGVGIYIIFAWQRNAVRRGTRSAQTSLPDVSRNGDAAQDVVELDIS